jgi:hypothetical protein
MSDTDEMRRKYQDQADAIGKEVWWRGEKFVPAGSLAEATPATKPALVTKVYKVITQHDEFFGGKFDPVKLETLINTLAAEGWRVVAVTAADVSTFFGSFWGGRGARQEMVVFMEKPAE